MNLKDKFSKGNEKEKNTEKKIKKKKPKRSVLDRVVIVFLALALLAGVSGLSVIGYIIAITDTSDLLGQMNNQEPTTFLDSNGEESGELGMESRQNIKLEQVPETVIDAFLAIEDSRFYSHNGFDLPRFISSALNNLRSGDLSQGGSTLTMQAIDNFFMKNEEEQMAKNNEYFSSVEKIERKMQEIYMSIRLESQASKDQIMERYLNQINFGDKARGIQRGAQYFFGKNVEDLNLSEAAYLAGCINAPNTYNPYRGYDSKTKANYYKAASDRRDETLYMMNYHGFISETEYKLAKSTKLAFQVVGNNASNADPFKNYLTAAASEVYKLYGIDPAVTPLIIHTNLDKDAQLAANEVADGKAVDLVEPYYQIGFSVIDNKTGGVIAFCPGRSDYEEEFYRNRSNLVERMPGSSIKPIIDYAYAFDNTGYCTSRVFNDKAVDVDGRTIRNSDGNYYGKISMERAIAQSLNTPAVNTLKASVDMNGTDDIIQYLLDMGFSKEQVNSDMFNLLYSIGGTMSTSPQEMAAAYATFANGGKYTTPHLVTKIEYKDGSKKPITVTPKTKQPLSPQAAYMMSDLLYKAVNGADKGWNLMGRLGFGAYPVYGKTGTSDWHTDGLKYGIPETAMKDEWMINYTSEYTIATWSGYDAKYYEQGYYVDTDLLFKNVPGWINKYMLDAISKNPTRIANPGGISTYGGGMIKNEWLKDAAKNNPMTIENMKSEMDALQALYDKYKGYASDSYTADSYAKFKTVLDKIKKMLEDDRATSDEIKAAKEELEAVANGLVENINKNALIDTINKAASLNSSLYTPESYNNLKNVVDTAKAVLGKDKLKQAEIDAQIAAVNNAINALVTIPTIDKSGLQNAINAGNTRLSQLPADSPNRVPLTQAIASASAIFNDAGSTQAIIDAAIATLNAAIAAATA